MIGKKLALFLFALGLGACGAQEESDAARGEDAFSLCNGCDQQVEVNLGSGVWAILGKGGNSVVVSDGETLVFDTKFDRTVALNRGATSLKKWITTQNLPAVTKIVNSHFHYDHTWGNALYPGADVYAHVDSRGLMRSVDSDVWRADDAVGLPTKTLGAFTSLRVGTKTVEVRLSGAGHTAGDAWMRIPQASLGPDADSDVIVTGDLIFHTYYPFFEEGPGGSSLSGNIRILRQLAGNYPEARFVPGHGPICGAADLLAYADYLEEMLSEIKQGLDDGFDEEQTVARVRPKDRWVRFALPSPHRGLLPEWAKAESSFRSAFRVVRSGS